MVGREADLGSSSANRLDNETHRKAQHVVAGHSANVEECAYFLAVLGIDIVSADEDELCPL